MQTIPFYITSINVLKIHHPSGRVRVAARNFHCLSFSLRGDMHITTAGGSFLSPTGSVTFVPEGVPFISEVDDSRDIIAVHFNAVGALPEDVVVMKPPARLSIDEDFRKLCAQYDQIGDFRAFSSLSLFYALLDKLFYKGEFRRDLPNEDHKIRPALDFIAAEYRSERASDVEYLASLCGFSSAYLRRLFANAFGMPPVEYVQRFRIEKACQLLSTGYYSVTECAVRCGFSSPCYFSKEFRRFMNVTPKQYAASYVSDSTE